jgi:hypothetical protein
MLRNPNVTAPDLRAGRIPKRRLAGGGDAPDGPDPGAQGKAAASPVNIFLGGALDRDSSHIVRDYADRFQQAHPETNVHYFPNDDCEGPLNTIRNASAGAPINLVGHSWGGPERGPLHCGYGADWHPREQLDHR